MKDTCFEKKKSINQNWNFQTDVWVKGGGEGGKRCLDMILFEQ